MLYFMTVGKLGSWKSWFQDFQDSWKSWFQDFQDHFLVFWKKNKLRHFWFLSNLYRKALGLPGLWRWKNWSVHSTQNRISEKKVLKVLKSRLSRLGLERLNMRVLKVLKSRLLRSYKDIIISLHCTFHVLNPLICARYDGTMLSYLVLVLHPGS